MSDTTAARQSLDKVQIAAMKTADRIIFRHTSGEGSRIEAVKEVRATEAQPFAQDVTVDVRCMFVADDFGSHSGGTDEYPSPPKEFTFDELNAGAFYGFEMFHSPQSNKVWQSIVGAMKAGDVIGLRWMRNAGTSPGIYKCGVVADRLQLWIERGDKHAGTFILSCHAVTVDAAERCRLVRRRAY